MFYFVFLATVAAFYVTATDVMPVTCWRVVNFKTVRTLEAAPSDTLPSIRVTVFASNVFPDNLTKCCLHPGGNHFRSDNLLNGFYEQCMRYDNEARCVGANSRGEPWCMQMWCTQQKSCHLANKFSKCYNNHFTNGPFLSGRCSIPR